MKIQLFFIKYVIIMDVLLLYLKELIRKYHYYLHFDFIYGKYGETV